MLFLAYFALFLILWALFAVAMPPAWSAIRAVASRAAAASMRYGRIQRVIAGATRFRDYIPVAALVAAGAVLAVSAGDGFLDLAELVHANSPQLRQADRAAHDWAVTRRTPSATLFFAIMTTVGGPIGVGAIGILAFAALVFRRHLHRAAYLAFAAGGGGLLDWELKRFFARARPDVAEMLRHAHGYSFPSGHAMGSTVVFTALAYLAVRGFPEWRWKAAAIALACSTIVAVALSRVYLGVHWISDVGAGVVAGLLWVGLTTVAYETFRRISLIRKMRGKAEW